MWTSSLRSLHVLNDGYRYSLTSDTEQVDQPREIKVQLRPHQKAVLYEMTERERSFQRGLDASGEKFFSRFGILGDGVGVGKSLMVLGHIARLKQQEPVVSYSILSEHSNSMMYSVKEEVFANDISNAGCLIVVPHTLYKQWENYVKTQTTLSFYGVKTKKYVEKEKWQAERMLSKDVVLVSNTLYGKFQTVIAQENIQWKRVFFDEADTVYIPSTQYIPNAKFTWLISASWANLLMPNTNLYYTYNQYSTYIQATNPHLDSQLVNLVQAWRNERGSTYSFLNIHYHMVSLSFFRPYLGSAHKLRGRCVVRCRDEFIQESVAMPPLYTRNILCKPSVAQRIVANAISADVRQLLHAGDFAGALQAVGANFQDSKSLIQAVTENRLKEIDRLQKTYEFKSSIEYASPQQKENALKHLRTKIEGLQEQVKSIRERIENYKEEICPICFDEPQSATLVPCCHRLFCGGCILTSLTGKSTCPLCRATIAPQELQHIADTQRTNNIQEQSTNTTQEPLRKVEQLLQLLREGIATNPQARFLIFSRFDNPLTQITQELSSMNIQAAQVLGNKDVIHRMLKQFEQGNLRVLSLNSIMAGAGMNITSATHVILLHAMNHEEEKQILGRAYRMGRKDPLQVIRLLHPDEILDSQQH
jgi:SNF2 family DNA or RNA helicase